MDTHLAEYKEKPGACAACGNSPINHAVTCTLNTAVVVLGSLFLRVERNPWLRRMEHLIQRTAEGIDAWHARFMHLLGAVRFGTEISRARTYRSQVIWEEAARRGIAMEQVFFLGLPTDIYRARMRGGWQYFKSIPLPPELPQDAYLWIDDKYALKRVLEGRGVPVPRARSVLTLAQARAAFEEIGAPVVVKPRSGSRGRHTTVGIMTREDLEAAFRSARQLCRFVSVERYLEGSVCRATLVAGRLVGFFKAEAPSVTGDGVSSVAQLIAARNERKPERVGDIVLTAEHEAYLRRQGLSPDAVPAQGRRVSLTHRTGRLFGGETREMLDAMHPVLCEQLERAALALGNAPVVGFDLIIGDPAADPAGQEWGIIEANSLPFIDLHYLPLYGRPSNPAAAIWDLWK